MNAVSINIQSVHFAPEAKVSARKIGDMPCIIEDYNQVLLTCL